MTRIFQTITLTSLILIGPGAAAVPPPGGVYSSEPPADVRDLLAKLKRGEDRVRVMNALARHAAAAPYIRLELQSVKEPLYRQDLSKIVQTIENEAYERNKDRSLGWAKSRRFDLMTEFLAVCRAVDAGPVADLAFAEQLKIGAEFARVLHLPNRQALWFLARQSRKPSQFQTIAGASISISRGSMLGGSSETFLRADVCDLKPCTRGSPWFMVVRSALRDAVDPVRGGGDWYACVVFVNNSMPFYGMADQCFIICDGDVELRGVFSNCVIIANGDIRGLRVPGPQLPTASVSNSILCAAGDIVLPDQRSGESNLFHAGGVVKLPANPGTSAQVNENRGDLRFGVRFLRPNDFGLELVARDGEVQVLGIKPWSPFARYGVEEGDVITHIDSTAAASVPTFRRALRRGVLRESVVLYIRRAGTELTRIVFLNGIPTPPTPMPR